MKKLLACLMFTCGSVAPAFAEEIVQNEVFGFEVALPDGWIKTTADTYFENISRLKSDDPAMQEAILKNANVPIVMAMKYPEPFDDINPSFKMNVRPYGAIQTRDGVELINAVLPGLQKIFTDMVVTSPPSAVTVGGKPGGHVAIEYTLSTESGDLPLASELWLIPDTNYFYMIGVGLRQDEATGSRSEAVSPVETIKFDSGGNTQ